MSKYEWESGEIIIPSAQWAAFKRSIRSLYNSQQEASYDEAVTIYERLINAAKGERDFKWGEALKSILNETSYPSRYPILRYHHVDPDQLCKSLWGCFYFEIVDGYREVGQPKRPLKKDFLLLDSQTKHIRAGDNADIFFDDEKRVVRWRVHENNHACENARNHRAGRAFFQALGQVYWTRGSGGVIVGNDEYNRNDESPGGGENYIKEAYGPIGEKERERLYGFKIPRSKKKRVS